MNDRHAMDLNSQSISLESCPYNSLDLTDDPLHMPLACGLCGRTLTLDRGVDSSLQPVSICDDCKFLLLEDFGTPARNSFQRRLPGRRSINGSADSTENFSRDFSQIINQARHIEPNLDNIFEDTDSNVSIVQPLSSRTTPSGSGRWRRMYSDTESERFNSDSFYGEGESSISTGAYRVYHGDSDSISFSSYEGDSSASVDGHTYTDIFVQSMDRSGIGSDSDIDPMHTGALNWNVDENGVEVGEWVEAYADENVVRPHDSDYYGERNRADSYRFVGMIHQRINEVRELQIPRTHMSVDEFDEAPHSDNPGDYFDAQEIEEFLENLVENDSSRRGAPPAALSSIDNLPLVVVCDEHVKPDGLACAICKDLLMIGTEVNQLPCFHLYHPSCILPWLSARNSCPLCRYELPTDDTDYELGKRNANQRVVISEIQMEDRDDSSSVTSNTRERVELQDVASRLEDVGPTAALSHTNYRGGGWLFLAAAPIVSLAGIFFALWLRNANSNPIIVARRGMTEQRSLHELSSQPIQTPGLCPHNHGVKRWWWWF